MNEADISNALAERLTTIDPAYPIVWPNKDAPEDIASPYLVFDPVPVSRSDTSYGGTRPRPAGFVMITVVTAANTFDTPAKRIADIILALFPSRLVLSITGGKVIIGDRTVIASFPDGPDWRTPVRVNYQAIKTT